MKWTRVRDHLEVRIDDAALPWTFEQVRRGCFGALIAIVVVALAAGGWPLAFVAVAASGIALLVVLTALRGRAGLEVDGALPDLLEATARSLRSGTSLRIALGEAAVDAPARAGAGLLVAVRSAERGVPLVDAIDGWAAATPGDGVRLAAAALALSSELGGSAARSLDAVAATLRDRNGLRREVRALSSQARASALVIALAPVGFAVIAGALDPGTTDFLLRSPVGIACLFVGVVLDGVGAAWMHRLATLT